MRNRISVFLRRLGEDKRSPRWPALRRHFLLAHPVCAWCGAKSDLEVHHVQPFHFFPERELDPKNLVTLCESLGWNCHLTVGHLGDWKKWNPGLLEDLLIAKRW